MICGILLATLFVLPANATFACRGNCNGGAGSLTKPNIFSPQTQVNGAGIYSERINYMLQFNIGQNISLIEIAPIGSTDWTPLVDGSQTSLHTTNGRIAHFHQDIFDGIYTFDIRVNGAVVWHNIEVKNGRLIVLGYDNSPIVVGVFDRLTNLRPGSGIDYCPAGYLNLFSPKVDFKQSQSILTESINYNFRFDIGKDITSIEIAPAGSTNWTPIVNADQMAIITRSNRVARIRQDIFDNMYTYDVRVNGAVVWHNIEVKNERLIIFGYNIERGYNNAPFVAEIIDAYRRACVPVS
jgi:hypothetical protein